MTHVLMTCDAVGGVWTYALDLIDALAPHGITCTLAVLGPPPSPEQREALARTAVADVAEAPWALEWMHEPWNDVAAATSWLRDLAADRHADLVHLNGYSAAAAEWNVPVLVVAHSDVVSWWRHVHGAEPPAAWQEYRRRVAAGLSAASALAAPTAAVLADLRRSFGCRRGVVVHNGRSANWLRASGVTVTKQPLVLGAGRMWDEAKNVGALQRVAPKIRGAVRIAGDPSSLGVLGSGELAEWMQRAAVFCAPARYEPFGLTALEAAMAGCALVLGDIASQRELWDGAACFVHPDDDEGLAHTLRCLLGNPVRRAAVADACARRAQAYGAAEMGAGYARLYADLSATAGVAV
jgi:glycogen(starch) synthase